MNWIGGTLSRSRNNNASTNANVSLLLKQKNHFAKARAKLQNGHRTTPPEIQYFDFGEWKPETEASRNPQTDFVARRSSSQKTLDQFENVQGVVEKLKSLRPRNQGTKRKRSLINDTEGYVLPSGIAIPPLSPTSVSAHSSSNNVSNQATPIANRNLKRARTSHMTSSDELYPLAALDTVEAKRRMLLQEADWAGVERQKRLSKPAKMKFTDAEDRDLIGRRRPLNGSAVQNRWKVSGSRPMKIPLMLPPCEEDEEWGLDGMSIRIGSSATNKGQVQDEILDRDQYPELMRYSSHPIEISEYNTTERTLKQQQRTNEAASLSSLRNESAEPFHSLFSPEEVEQSGIAQMVEAATIAEEDTLALAANELQLPEDYHFINPEPNFRLNFEQTPRLRSQTSQLHNVSSPLIRDFAYTRRPSHESVVEQGRRLGFRGLMKDPLSESASISGDNVNTSPLSIATSRYMQELERQSFGCGIPTNVTDNAPNRGVSMGGEPTLTESTSEEQRGRLDDEKSKVPVYPEETLDNDTIQSNADEDALWRDFTNLDGSRNDRPSQEQRISTQLPVQTVQPSSHEKQTPDQTSAGSKAQKMPPPPEDDELIWRKFIFSSPNLPNRFTIEEASPEPPPSDSYTSPYSPTRTQPSLVAEAATTPVKQNPHLMDDSLDDSTSLVLDNASHYAHAATTSPVHSIPEKIAESSSSSEPQQASPYYPALVQSLDPSSSSSFSLPTPTIPTRRKAHLPPHPNASSPPSSLLSQALFSTTTDTSPTRPPSSDHPSRPSSHLPPTPQPTTTATKSHDKEKVTFKKPSRYIGSRASETTAAVLHLGRNVGVRSSKRKKEGHGKGKGKEKRSLVEAVERAKQKMTRDDRWDSRKKKGKGKNREGRDESEEEEEARVVEGEENEEGEGEETEQDDIVDD